LIEDAGQHLPFESNYWNGKYPVGGGYPLAFHPLELGEEALRHFFGFNLEGDVRDDDFDPSEISLNGFTVS